MNSGTPPLGTIDFNVFEDFLLCQIGPWGNPGAIPRMDSGTLLTVRSILGRWDPVSPEALAITLYSSSIRQPAEPSTNGRPMLGPPLILRAHLSIGSLKMRLRNVLTHLLRALCLDQLKESSCMHQGLRFGFQE
jgi:hypothetical protein